jgi:conjugative transfer signal peptidase TraF
MFTMHRVVADLSTAERRIRAAAIRLVAAWLLALAAILVATSLGLRLNISPSVPLGFYRLSRAPAARGDYVAVCPPPSSLFRLAREHGYLMSGPCPGDFVPMFKVLAAIAGDNVRVEAAGVSINGRLWPRSEPRRVDGSGWPLPQLAGLRTTLRRDDVFLMSDNCLLGFDGRYFGALPSSVITAAAVPLLTW